MSLNGNWGASCRKKHLGCFPWWGSFTTRKQTLGPPQKYKYKDEPVSMHRYWLIFIPVLLGWMEFMNEP
jgi:hypothetical protein